MNRPSNRSAITLEDVAKLAGVSVITVSRVVRNKGPISAETRCRVRAAVAQSGYVPNRIAGSLASAASDLIGVVVPSLSNIVFADVLRGINTALAREGYRPVVGVTEYSLEEEDKLVRSLLSWRPAALIVTGLDHLDSTVATLRASATPIVEIMDIDAEPINISVGFSHHAAGRTTAKHLLSRGYRRIAYVGHDMQRDLRSKRRHEGFRSVLQESGLRFAEEIVLQQPSNVDAGRYGLARVLREHNDIDAVYFSNDDMAIGGIFHCMAESISVPEQLALTGFNGLDIGQALPKPLTTILTYRAKIGEKAAEMAIDQIRGQHTSGPFDVGFKLVLGQTS